MEGIPWSVCAQNTEAAVTKLDGKSADEDEQHHDECPLASTCMHMKALRHQGEVKYHAKSDGSRQQESSDGSHLPLILQVNSQGDIGLQPAEQGSQSKHHKGADVVNVFLSE